MSSTNPHYQGPSSLPSDYALLSHMAGRRPETDDVGTTESDDTDDTITPKPRTTGVDAGDGEDEVPFLRKTGTRPYYRPANPSIGVYPDTGVSNTSVPTEHTPLLAPPPVPRIEEEVDSPAHDNDSSMAMFWEELPILTKYALPVFG